MKLGDKVGDWSIGAVIAFVVAALIQMNYFVTRSEAYKEFVLKEDYKADIVRLQSTLDKVLDKLEQKEDKQNGR